MNPVRVSVPGSARVPIADFSDFRSGERGRLARSCPQHSGVFTERLKTVSASCRDLQAGSLCSPENRTHVTVSG